MIFWKNIHIIELAKIIFRLIEIISFDRNSFNLKNIGSGSISINHEWPSDYLIYFLNSESVIAKSRYKNSKKIINELNTQE